MEEALLCFHVCNAFLGVQAVQEPGEDVSVCKNPNLRGSMSEKSTRSLKTEAAPTLPTSAFSADAQSGGRAPHLPQGATLNLSLLNQGQGWTQHSQRGALFYITGRNKLRGETCQGADLWRLPEDGEACGQALWGDMPRGGYVETV